MGYNIYSGQLSRLLNQANDATLPGPSPRHAVIESDDERSQQEHQVPSGTGGEYGGTQFESTVIPGGGMELDTPAPWARDLDAAASRIKYAMLNPHDSRAVLTLRQGDQPDGGRLAAHDGSQDKGWKRTTFAGEPLADDVQAREADRTDGYSNPFSSVSEPDAVKYVRGRGSRPETNPDGFRLGNLWRWSWDPQRNRHVHRDYGVQYTQPRDFYTAPARQVMVKNMVSDVALPRTAGSFDDAVMSGNGDMNHTSTANSSFGGF